MKKVLGVFAVAVVALGFGIATSQAGTIVGSKHDLSSMAAAGGELCVACHTPHKSDTSVTDAPLWNHSLTTATYTLYASPTFNGSGSVGQPAGVSKLCLSCHDGTVAIDAFGGQTGTSMIATAGNLGTDLKKSHPISFTFDSALITADGELKAPPAGWVNNNKFECSSCHDVHNKSGVSKMLHVSNASSALCLNCHVK